MGKLFVNGVFLALWLNASWQMIVLTATAIGG